MSFVFVLEQNWSPLIVDARTIAHDEINSEMGNEGSTADVTEGQESNNLLQQNDDGLELSSNIQATASQKILVQNSIDGYHSKPQNIDIVSAAFADAELDQFDPTEGNFE